MKGAIRFRRVDYRFSWSPRLRSSRSGAAIALLLTALAIHAHGQTASLSGTVADSWEIAVPNANLTLTNSQTGASLNTATNQEGAYVFSQVAAGRYDLT